MWRKRVRHVLCQTDSVRAYVTCPRAVYRMYDDGGAGERRKTAKGVLLLFSSSRNPVHSGGKNGYNLLCKHSLSTRRDDSAERISHYTPTLKNTLYKLKNFFFIRLWTWYTPDDIGFWTMCALFFFFFFNSANNFSSGNKASKVSCDPIYQSIGRRVSNTPRVRGLCGIANDGTPRKQSKPTNVTTCSDNATSRPTRTPQRSESNR